MPRMIYIRQKCYVRKYYLSVKLYMDIVIESVMDDDSVVCECDACVVETVECEITVVET